MLTPCEIRARLSDRNIQDVARASGVSANAIYRLMNDKKSRPLYTTIEKLSRYLEMKP